MSYSQIRSSFVKFFQKNHHTLVASSSLVPQEDPSILFTNAGMNQFKNIFLGIEQREYTRAISIQRCLRAGGKHNDLENVGYTARHHTFFEMLGNFSFGDYFKKEAMEMAFDYITRDLQLPLEKLWFTVHESDDEAFSLWRDHLKVPEKRISRCSDKDNFWAMGDVGPCGPCTEIFFDHGDHLFGGPPGSADQDGDRFKEIWNLVFMQYQKQPDGSLLLLPKPCVDTGMGLERLACVLEGVDSNFETSLFRDLKKPLVEYFHKQTNPVAYNVISDHLRAALFMIHDGIFPSAEARGYVLRRIIRRALRYGFKLGATQPFLYQFVQHAANLMKDADHTIINSIETCQKVIRREEEMFLQTLATGMKYFQDEIDSGIDHLKGDFLFKLYDTYGFPIDLAVDLAKENNLSIDKEGFDHAMNIQKNQSRLQSKFDVEIPADQLPVHESLFLRDVSSCSSNILQVIAHPKNTELCWVILEQSPFYAESGGQVGDTGWLKLQQQTIDVLDTQKIHHQRACLVQKHDAIKTGSACEAVVDWPRRQAIAKHHSATHLLHAALRQTLGESVMQKGSYVGPDKLRFDFSFERPLTNAELTAIEKMVNQEILKNVHVVTEELSKDEALKKGALAFFGDKYGQKVRMLTMGHGFSKELCGGTHVHALGSIGYLKITSDESVSAGIRRLSAVAGEKAFAYLDEKELILNNLAALMETPVSMVLEAVEKLKKDLAQTKNQLMHYELKELSRSIASLDLQHINGVDFAFLEIQPQLSQQLKLAADLLKDRSSVFSGGVYCIEDDKIKLVLVSSKQCPEAKNAKSLFSTIHAFNLKGGGRADFIQAGGQYAPDLEIKIKEQFNLIL